LRVQFRKNAPLALDTNLSVLFCVGLCGKQFINSHKRLDGYDETDFDLLTQLVPSNQQLILSPYVLAETSNLLRQANGNLRLSLAIILKALADQGTEIQIACAQIASHASYLQLGFTDAALLTILEQNSRVQLLTSDFELYGVAVHRGLSAFNFSHARNTRPDFQ
jgi:predicted nucleic acid-binding protein